jgi:uncharacterized membrane protein
VGTRWGTSRTEAFSDGVFAIAITLLVLELGVPEAAFDDLWQGILDQWPSYLAFATSFLTVGGLWLAHHAIFRRLETIDGRIMRLNLLLLMAVSFLPFPTRLLAEAIDDTDAERAAVIFYGATLLVISLLLAAIWGAVASRRELLRPDVTDEEVNEILGRTAPSVGGYIVVILLAIVAPHVAAFGFLLVAMLLVLRVKGDGPDALTEA